MRSTITKASILKDTQCTEHELRCLLLNTNVKRFRSCMSVGCEILTMFLDGFTCSDIVNTYRLPSKKIKSIVGNTIEGICVYKMIERSVVRARDSSSVSSHDARYYSYLHLLERLCLFKDGLYLTY